ncbi:hypothetical protein LEP1GSC202_2372 [Leptospira yanagawae serovar Saopaulo str. Sao Paulo = ATCC 700523]|uniref:Uncharacterized protein n=1 Tax=Leptospira yanagawae serovar Saopaulo str. Sao Paulo = ATCC 700523 TaxID=1249483 RepID=A0A5E8HA69_9LEPT|nr:hypothetical protein LEP1GSC202_2372 [Leptospira yanagawae serovar Saopaulo str. Sao Paulo = ATCC 700523]
MEINCEPILIIVFVFKIKTTSPQINCKIRTFIQRLSLHPPVKPTKNSIFIQNSCFYDER